MTVGLQGIFHNGVAGMLAFEQGMGAISDNIANQNTVGYKRVETLFSTILGQVDHQIKQGDSASAALQARNVAGVKPTTRQLTDVQGAIQTTNRQYDLAISGQGMFIFGVGEITNGAFTSEGHVYSRAGDLSPFIPSTVVATLVTPETAAYLTNKNGHFLMAQEITAADLLVTPPTPPASLDELVPIQLSDQNAFAGQPTTLAELAAVIPASGATTVTTPIFYVDTNGDQQGVTLVFSNPVVTAGTDTTWDVSTIDSLGVTQPTFATLTFDSSGQLAAGSTLTIADNGNTFTLDVENLAMLGDSAGGTSAQAVQVGYTQDGIEAGAFEGLEFREDGVVFGKYSGGGTQPLYRIPLVSFSNPNALESLAGNEYQATAEAGDPVFRVFGDQFARMVINAVESSNVDLADSFTQMIIIQRAYSSAATVVRTADEMSGVVRDLMR